MYANFFAAVRDVNRRLPASKRLRVFAGDPPIDWSKVRTAEAFQAIVVHRDDFPVSILRDQILKNGEKALVIYGGAHAFLVGFRVRHGRRYVLPRSARLWCKLRTR